MATIDSKLLTQGVKDLVKTLQPRNRDIISRRFGLKTGSSETLESIGSGYDITRERVRQIEAFSLAHLTRSVPNISIISRTIDSAKSALSQEGGVLSEKDLFAKMIGSNIRPPIHASLGFVLGLDKDIVHVSENNQFHPLWALDKKSLDALTGQVNSIISALSDRGTAISEDEIATLASSKNIRSLRGDAFRANDFIALTNIAKEIGANQFGQLGLAKWGQISPRGIKDKAYLVVKQSGEPQHFTSIAELIYSAKLDNKNVNVQTVHNELIKDSRFVLVGRGLYGLTEWGYKAGTVKDVLKDILREKGNPIPRADLISLVKDRRMVKDNTILLNLQDSGTFIRTADGSYQLRKR